MKNRLTLASRITLLGALLVFGATLSMAQTAKQVSHSDAVEAATNKPAPDYSPIAKQLKVQGQVQVKAYVSEDGKVERVEAVSGNPILFKCADDAVRRWKFNPFTEDGKPTKAVANLTFTFKL